jgi:hypothetical protein
MAIENINVGATANDGNGDPLRNAFIKCNDNFDDLDTTKQDTLVSGTNIKTLEGQSLLGSGNIDLTKSDVGLSNVDNTSDVNKPISSATQTALNAKQDTLVSGTNIKTLEGQSLLGSGNIDLTKSDVGLSNVDNTSDANKPVSTAQNTAINAKVTDAIVNGVTTVAPSQNAVFDALATKQDVITNPITGTGTINKLAKFSTTSEIAQSLVYDDGVTVAVGTGTPEPSAILEVFSNTQGFLLPRMTDSEMNAITSPAIGLMVFNTDNQKINVHTLSGWLAIPF